MKMKTQLEIDKSIRKFWTFSPVTRVKTSKKVYSRKNYKMDAE